MPVPPVVVASRSAPDLHAHAHIKPIYLDNLATTPVDPRVLEAMLPFFTDHFGNASSRTHRFGWTAADALERSREQVASLIGASPKEIVFTSGATESTNLAIKGVAESNRHKGNHIIVSATEHPATLDCCAALEKRGFEVTFLGVDEHGILDMRELERSVTERTILINVMAANNEIGSIQPLAELGALAQERGISWHCDAAQAVGKFPVNVTDWGVSLLSISAHKLYGPKGQGALFVRRRPRPRLTPQQDGGGQENGLRPGTANVPGIVGLGKACELCQSEMEGEAERIRSLRDRLQERIQSALPDVVVNGHPGQRLAGCLNLSFPGVDGAALIRGLGEIAVSAGSACTSGSSAPSHVLKAIGRTDDMAFSSLRFGLGRFNTETEIDTAAGRVVEEVRRAGD